MKYNCGQFTELLRAVKKYPHAILNEEIGYANGRIGVYSWRLFQSAKDFDGDIDNVKYEAFLCIQDERAVKSKWPAFYSEEDVDKWAFEKGIKSTTNE